MENTATTKPTETPFAVRGRWADGGWGVDFYATAAEARAAYKESIARNADGFLHPHFLLVIDGQPVKGKQL